MGSREGRQRGHSASAQPWSSLLALLLGFVRVWEVVKLARNVLNYLSVLLLGCLAVELTAPFN